MDVFGREIGTLVCRATVTKELWKEIEDIFDREYKKIGKWWWFKNFFENSIEYVSNEDKVGLENLFKEKGKGFMENVFCNIASSVILKLFNIIDVTCMEPFLWIAIMYFF